MSLLWLRGVLIAAFTPRNFCHQEEFSSFSFSRVFLYEDFVFLLISKKGRTVPELLSALLAQETRIWMFVVVIMIIVVVRQTKQIATCKLSQNSPFTFVRAERTLYHGGTRLLITAKAIKNLGVPNMFCRNFFPGLKQVRGLVELLCLWDFQKQKDAVTFFYIYP